MMTQSKKILVASLFSAASLVVSQAVGRAAVYAEVGDAGQTLLTASNAGVVTGFSGTLGSTPTTQDADLYSFSVATSGTYVFSDTGLLGAVDTTAGGTLDTAIFLFNSAGAAIATNDDAAGGLTAASSFTVSLLAGTTYYFGISTSGNEAVNSANQLLFTGYPAGDTTATRGAASGVNPTTLSNFNSNSYTNDAGTYNVTITNAVPEPSTWAALALGSLAAGATFLRRRSA